MALTGLVAGLVDALGVDLAIEGGETIPVSGIVFQTGVFSPVGAAIAAALLRWSARPTHRFVWTAGTLTVTSLVPPSCGLRVSPRPLPSWGSTSSPPR